MTRLLRAVVTSDINYLCNFMQITIVNLFANDEQLSNTEVRFGMSRRVEVDGIYQSYRASVKNHSNYTIGTAGSQMSKCRFALMRLGYAVGVERAKEDVIKLTDTGRKQLRKLVDGIVK
jgi:hypothetical protein